VKKIRGTAGFGNLGSNLRAFLFPSAGEYDLCALVGEGDCCCFADAGRSSGYSTILLV
jgi:hypothetical protein